mmetsp:Transcript_35080/g.78672  ORF Transcript_35080/g.78672 Transcript_35080/m.78672 type:complete len:516 (-) Transcript_35080:102-1649(-)
MEPDGSVVPAVLGRQGRQSRQGRGDSRIQSAVKARTDDMAFWMARMEVTHPDILRGVPAFRVLQCFGRVLRNAGNYYNFSSAVQAIDEFCSHSWHGESWKKISLLLILKNGVVAFWTGTLGAIITTCFFCMDYLPGYFRRPFLGSSTYKYGPWALLTGLLVSAGALLLWRPRQTMFVDRVCIHQVDQSLKTEGVFNMGAFLKNSTSLLVLWDTTYATRLWCMFELAAFLQSHSDGSKHLQIRPLFLAPCILAIGLCTTLMMMFELMVPFVSIYVVILKLSLLTLSCVTAARLLFLYYSSVRALQTQLRVFRMQDARCFCCEHGHIDEQAGAVICDREIVTQCICQWFGSVEGFEGSVRTTVSSSLAAQLGHFPCPYWLLLQATAPVLWAHFDMVAARIHAGDFEFAVAVAIQALAWWLALFPSSLFLVAVSYKFYERQWRGCLDRMMFCLSLLAPVVSLAGGVGYMYVCLRYVSNAIVGALIFAFTMMIPATLALRIWSKPMAEPSEVWESTSRA